MNRHRLSLLNKTIFVEACAQAMIVQLKQEKAESAEARHERMIDRAGKTERKFKAALRKYFKRQCDAILETMPDQVFMDADVTVVKAHSKRICKDLLELYQNDREAWREELETLAGIHVTDAVKQTGEAEMKEFAAGISFKVTNPRVERQIRERTNKMSFTVSDETMRKLRATLAEGSAAGEGIPDIRRRVQDTFDDMSKYRAERIARTETIWGANAGAEEAWIQSGVIEGKEWHAAADACAFCANMHGTTMGLGQAFFEHGDRLSLEDGGTMVFDYEEVQHPPLHPLGRCSLLPIVKEVAVQKTAEEVRQEVIATAEANESAIAGIEREFEAIQLRAAEAYKAGNESAFDDIMDHLLAQQEKAGQMRKELKGKIHEILQINRAGAKSGVDFNVKVNRIAALNRGEDWKEVTKWTEKEVREFSRYISEGVWPQGGTVEQYTLKPGIRACYEQHVIYVSRSSKSSTVAHELGHWLEENNQQVREAALEFLKARTKGERAVKLANLSNSYRTSELAKKDKFLDPYMGKIYENDKATEIISSGIQYIYEKPLDLATKDPEYFNFMVETLWGLE